MTKKLFALALALSVFLCGCSLAQEETLDGRSSTGDMLIGVFITEEHLDLFDFEAYLNDNLDKVMNGGLIEGDTSAYENRIYAVREGKEEDGVSSNYYVFEGLEGYPFFTPTITEGIETYTTICMENGISEIKQDIKSVDDSILELTLTGTMYVASDLDYVSFFLNPVYQDVEGNVYLTAGTGLSTNGLRVGGSMSQNYNEEVTVTTNGESTTKRCYVEVTYEGVNRPEEITVLQMSADHLVLSRETYTPGKLPKEITPLEDTEYFLVETRHAGGTDREIFGRDQVQIKSYVAVENGICENVLTKILWNEEKGT